MKEIEDNKMAFKSQIFEAKAISDGKNLYVEGYASTFGVKDSYGDIVVRGAYLRTLRENGKRIKLCLQHNMDDVVGKIIELKEDAYGLYFKAKISNTTKGKDLVVLVEDEAINEISIGYSPIITERNEGDDTRYLKDVELYEISFVSRAANRQAVITSTEVKSEKKIEELTDDELFVEYERLKAELTKRIFLKI